MKPIYMVIEDNRKILCEYLGVNFGAYRFEVINDFSKYSPNVDKLTVGKHLYVLKEAKKSGKVIIRKLTLVEFVLYGSKGHRRLYE